MPEVGTRDHRIHETVADRKLIATEGDRDLWVGDIEHCRAYLCIDRVWSDENFFLCEVISMDETWANVRTWNPGADSLDGSTPFSGGYFSITLETFRRRMIPF